MPTVHIKALPQEKPEVIPQILKSICSKVAEIAKVPEFGVHVTWENIAGGCYGEANTTPDLQPKDTHPPIVDFLMYEGRSDNQISDAIEVIAKEIYEGLGLGEGNVFIHFKEATSGRVYTGGAIKKS